MYIHSNVSISDCTQHADSRINILYTILITTQRTSSRKRLKRTIHIEWTRDDDCSTSSTICPGARRYSLVLLMCRTSLTLAPFWQCFTVSFVHLCTVRYGNVICVGWETLFSSIHGHPTSTFEHLPKPLCPLFFVCEFRMQLSLQWCH